MVIAPQSPSLLWVVAAILAALTTGTLVRLVRLRGTDATLAKSRLDSLRTWWLVAIVVIAAAVLGVVTACVVFTVVSLLAFAEFQRLAKTESSPPVRWLVYTLIPVAYLLIGLGLPRAFQILLPLVTVVLLSVTLVCEGRPGGFLNTASKSVWGFIITAYMPGHVVLLFGLPSPEGVEASGADWFLLLVVLTETSDIMQALVGRRVGHRKLAPIISPNKTWEGLVGGIASTILLAALLAPWLTSLTLLQGAVGGLLIAIVGLFGDLNISALKRDAGVKDCGTLLPGQGGVLDRIDSLTFTAPAFYYFAQATIG